ncbi:MAG: hypothetical protein ACOX45_07055 [Acutalibacteraceae bacterium]
MGAWGPKLYQDDIAQEVRDYYKDQLHRGKTGEEITQELIKQNEYAISDIDDAPTFWFALADTQWNLGRLEDLVKEKALNHIFNGYDLRRWEAEDSKGAKIRAKVIEELRQKLLSPQPAEKKISQYKLYKCEWNIGDVYAYQLESDMAKERGLYGRYFLIQKVDEGVWHPGHIVPIVYVKITSDTNLPSNVEEFNRLEYVQTWFAKYEERFLPVDMSRPQEDIAEKSKINYIIDDYGFLPQYRAKLLNTSKRVIPSKLLYLGNYTDAIRPKNEFIPHIKENIITVSWKNFDQTFETQMIKKYCEHNLRELSIYKVSNI